MGTCQSNDDKTPKLRTEDEKNTLRFLFNKMRKFPKDLIAEIKNKCPSLQRKPKTAEERKEQKRIIEHNKRSEESETDKEMRLTQKKEYASRKRSEESEIERERRLTQDKECHSRKRSAESEIDKEMRLKKQKEYNEKRI